MGRVKVDLHVHSHYSDSPKIYLLAKANSRECYTSPEDVYQRAMARGMNMVTITDHDTIDGALEIAHHGDHVFLSEEVSARFPDNGCVMHVLVFGITEAQHREIQRLRYNIYDLVAYLRQEDILHSLAHPLSSVNHRLRREHLERSLLLFNNLELLNGPRDPYHQKAIEQIVGSVTRERLEMWANKYQIEPVNWDLNWGYTGGSDDHSGIAIARAYTEFDGPCTFEGLRNALNKRETRIAGEYMTPISAAHNIYSGVVQYYMDRKQTRQDEGIYSSLFDIVQSPAKALPLLSSPELQRSPLGRILKASVEHLSEMNQFTWEKMMSEGDKESFHIALHDMAMKITRKAFSDATQDIVEATSELHLDKIVETLPAILQMLLLHTPYYLGFRYFYQDRRRAEVLHSSLELGYKEKEEPSVAIFMDTLDDVNGVSLGLRRMIRELRQAGKKVYLIGTRTETVGASASSVEIEKDDLDVEAVIRFEPLASFEVPGYNHLKMGIPPLLEMMRWCVENEIELIQASTPGPTGLAALTISKLLGAPIVGHYHTQIPEYAERLLGDKNISALVGAYVTWFYNSLDRVIVPSRATLDNLVARGLRPERLEVVSRGVDTERFKPENRNRAVWKRYGLNGATKLLYVGRISKEKNLDDLVECYKELRDEGIHVELGIVGDGPYREALGEKVADTPGVIFTGYIGGTELAELFASADVFVFPSTTDTFGNVVLEAQASSLPAIVTDQGGPSELVVHNRTGMIVPSHNRQALADAVKRLVVDDDLRSQMSTAARDHASQMRYDRAASELWNFYSKQIKADFDVRESLVERGI